MSALEIILIIGLPIVYLIGRYYKAVKETNHQNLSKARDYWQRQYYDVLNQVKNVKAQNEIEANESVRLLTYSDSLSKQLITAKQSINQAPKFQVVANKDKHPAANDSYLYIEGEINGNREAGLLRLKQWEDAKATLLKNPEDKPQ